MGNSSSKKRKEWASTQGSSTDVEPSERPLRGSLPFRKSKTTPSRDFSPFRGSRGKTEPPLSSISSNVLLDVPGKPGKAVVTLTNLQSDRPSGSCVTDSIYLDWTSPLADGGRPVLGYSVEMYDLPTGNWVMVTQTEGDTCRSMLDNILCGIMYRFRVRAFNEIGNSVHGIPSDAFVIDTPGVHIAPYFILCPLPEVVKLTHDTAKFRAKALGTPKPNILWQKDEEPIFITDGIEILEESDGSLLTVHNLQCGDEGLIQCVAVNHVGKAVASTNLRVVSVPKFIGGITTAPLQFTFRAEEMIRLKFPFRAQPQPELQVLRQSQCLTPGSGGAKVFARDGQAIFRIDNAGLRDAASYTLIADNGHGRDEINFTIDIEVPPDPPGTPEVLDVTSTGQLSLAWDPPQTANIDHYIVEYYRDQWQLWLRMKTCIDPSTTVTDLIPGSKYKFRIMSASVSGISEASEESEEVMIGKAPEDELFDLPGPQGGRLAAGRRGRMMARTRKMPSLDRSSLDRGQKDRLDMPEVGRRHTSLDREVYYDAENVRRDVVTYKGQPGVEMLGQTVSSKYRLSNQELNKYKTSMTELCHRMKAMSSNPGTSVSSRSSGLNDSMLALKLEVTNQARKSSSLYQLTPGTSDHLDQDEGSRAPGKFPASLSSSNLVSGNAEDCKKSLTDIRDRIGSLQSLLKASRTLTSSKQSLFADIPGPTKTISAISQPIREVLRKTSLSNRSDSYSKAIEDDPSPESQYQETHFPYKPGMASLGSLLCDKPENRQQTEDDKIPHVPGNIHPPHVPGNIHPPQVPGNIHPPHVPENIHPHHVPGNIHLPHVPKHNYPPYVPLHYHSPHTTKEDTPAQVSQEDDIVPIFPDDLTSRITQVDISKHDRHPSRSIEGDIPVHIPTCLSPEEKRASFYLTEVEDEVTEVTEMTEGTEVTEGTGNMWGPADRSLDRRDLVDLATYLTEDSEQFDEKSDPPFMHVQTCPVEMSIVTQEPNMSGVVLESDPRSSSIMSGETLVEEDEEEEMERSLSIMSGVTLTEGEERSISTMSSFTIQGEDLSTTEHYDTSQATLVDTDVTVVEEDATEEEEDSWEYETDEESSDTESLL